MSEHIQAHTDIVLQRIEAKADNLEKELASVLSGRAFDKQFRTRAYFLGQKNSIVLAQKIHIENRVGGMYTAIEKPSSMPEARAFCEDPEGHMISNVVSYHHRIKDGFFNLILGGRRETHVMQGRSLIDTFIKVVTAKQDYFAKHGIILSDEVKKNMSKIAIKYAILDMCCTKHSLERYGVETDEYGVVEKYIDDKLHSFIIHLDTLCIQKFKGISEESFATILSYVYQTFLLQHYKDDASFRNLIEGGNEDEIISYIHRRYL